MHYVFVFVGFSAFNIPYENLFFYSINIINQGSNMSPNYSHLSYEDYVNRYSDKEMKLISFFGFAEIVKNDKGHSIATPSLYRMMVEKAFIENMKGTEVESLRRCAKALYTGKINRLTTEWDEMIED